MPDVDSKGLYIYPVWSGFLRMHPGVGVGGERLVLLTLDHKVPSSNPARGGILLMTVWRIVALSLSLLSFHSLEYDLLYSI